jgi:hypothetical protein
MPIQRARKKNPLILVVQWNGDNIDELRQLAGVLLDPLAGNNSNEISVYSEKLRAWIPVPLSYYITVETDGLWVASKDELEIIDG